MDRMIAHILHLPHEVMLRIQHFNIVVTLVRIHVLALKHDELRRLDDLSVGVEMASRKSCMKNDELPMMSEPHFSSSQSPMLATTHENISGIRDMVEEPCVGIVHKEHMDLQTEEERYGLELVDLTHTHQYEESESPLLEFPMMD
jgi:hypothetical protein